MAQKEFSAAQQDFGRFPFRFWGAVVLFWGDLVFLKVVWERLSSFQGDLGSF